MKNGLQQVIDQIGMDNIHKSMGDIAMGNCDIHGHYTWDMSADTNLCPLCPAPNGLTATEVEHFINVNPIDGTNPQQKLNPIGF